MSITTQHILVVTDLREAPMGPKMYAQKETEITKEEFITSAKKLYEGQTGNKTYSSKYFKHSFNI